LYTERHTGLGFGFDRPWNDYVTASVGIRGENVKTSHLGSIPESEFIRQEGDQLVASFALTQDRRDQALDPSRGNWANIMVEPGVAHTTAIGGALQNANLLGTHGFERNTAEYRVYYTPQPPRGRNFDAPRKVFAFRLRYGFITGTPPFFEQYFVGGADTLRGYDDDRFWGTQELISSLEYRYPIQKSFNLIPFIDYGGAWGGYGNVSTFTQSREFRLHLAGGMGVAFRTPLGQIRIDLGVNERGGTRPTFLIGNSF